VTSVVVPSSVDATGVETGVEEAAADETDADEINTDELGRGLGDAGTETDIEVGATLLSKQAVQTVEVEVNV
jgi:hypothetical protein